MEEKYIIDTDIWDDIDDAFALLLALRAELDLVGITTVFRNSLQRAKMTKRLLSLFGKPEIPVRAGVDTAITQFPVVQIGFLCTFTCQFRNSGNSLAFFFRILYLL